MIRARGFFTLSMEAQDGESVFEFRLGDYMDLVDTVYDSGGNIVLKELYSADIPVYCSYGLTDVFSECTFTHTESNAIIDVSINNGVMTVEIPVNATLIGNHNVTVYATYKNVTRQCTFHLNVTAPGASRFSIYSDIDCLKFIRGNSGELVPAKYDVNVGVIWEHGGSRDILTPQQVSTNHRLLFKYIVDDVFCESDDIGDNVPANGSIEVSNSARESLYLALFDRDGTMLDSRSIPVVKDGQNGPKGDDAPSISCGKIIFETQDSGQLIHSSKTVTPIGRVGGTVGEVRNIRLIRKSPAAGFEAAPGADSNNASGRTVIISGFTQNTYREEAGEGSFNAYYEPPLVTNGTARFKGDIYVDGSLKASDVEFDVSFEIDYHAYYNFTIENRKEFKRVFGSIQQDINDLADAVGGKVSQTEFAMTAGAIMQTANKAQTTANGFEERVGALEVKAGEVDISVGYRNERRNMIHEGYLNLVDYRYGCGLRKVWLEAGHTYLYSVCAKPSQALVESHGYHNRVARNRCLNTFVYLESWASAKNVEFHDYTRYETKYVWITPSESQEWHTLHYAFPRWRDEGGTVEAADAEQWFHVLWEQMEDITDRLPSDWNDIKNEQSELMKLATRFSLHPDDCNESHNLLAEPRSYNFNENVGRQDTMLPDGSVGTAYVISSDSFFAWCFEILDDFDSCYILDKEKTYTLSFHAKGSGSFRIGVAAVRGVNHLVNRGYASKDGASVGNFAQFSAKPEWEKYEVSISGYNNEWSVLLIRGLANSNVSICNIKLEEGGRARSGLQDTALKAGINLKDGTINMEAARFQLHKQSTGEMVFGVNAETNELEFHGKADIYSNGPDGAQVTIQDGMALFRRGNGNVRVGVDADNNPIIYGTTINNNGSETTLWMLGHNGTGTPQHLKGSIGYITYNVATSQTGNTAFDCEVHVSDFTIRNVSSAAFTPNNTLRLRIVMPNGSADTYIPDNIGNLAYNGSHTVYVNQNYDCIIPYNLSQGSQWLTLAQGGTIYAYAYLEYNGEVIAERSVAIRL